MTMQWTLAVAALMVGQAWAQNPALPATVPTERPSENIALGAACTIDPGPNYGLCSDPGDREQVTDGKYTEGYFWAQTSTVGWQEKTPSVFTLDLGEVKPIRGVSFHTAGGFASVRWPQTIRILVADEEGQFHEIGDLVQLSEEQHGPLVPTRANDAMWAMDEEFSETEIHHHYELNRDLYPPEITPEVREQILRDINEDRAARYGTYRYWTDRLRTHGRYVSVLVWNEPYTFVDEIEVYAGEPEWLDEPLPGPAIEDPKEYASRLAVQKGIRTRLVQDIEALREAAATAGVADQTRKAVLAELAAVEAELGDASWAFGDDFQAVLPLNPWHERVLRTQARLWRDAGLRPLTFWSSNLWDPLPLVGAPDMAADMAVEVHLMRKEHRAAAFNVSNSSDEPARVEFRLRGLPGGDNPGYVTVHEVVWTDTRQGVPVAAALPEVDAVDDLYAVTVPAGMTRQVWLTFHPVDVVPGVHEGEVVVESGSEDVRFPLRLHLYPLDFPEQQTLHLGGWDYTDRIGHFRYITEHNRLAIVQHLRERRVDSPWGLKLAVPRGTHDAKGVMTEPPSTEYFDAWMELWPNAAQYMVFAKVGDKFQSFEMGTPEFDTAVEYWVTFWAEYMVAKGKQQEQLALLLVDEPDEPYQDARILAWAKPIRAANTGVRIWEDVTHADMDQANQEMIDSCHVLSPNYMSFLGQGPAYRDYYLKKRDQGIALEFYTAWLGRVFDPYAGRLNAWSCWRFGADAFYLWSLTDTGDASSWNAYQTIKSDYSPIFLDETSVTAGKHLEAAREGVQDYEYFAMLDQAIEEAATGPEVEKARRLLETLPLSVLRDGGHETLDKDNSLGGHHWLNENVDRTLADKARIQVLETLTALTAR